MGNNVKCLNCGYITNTIKWKCPLCGVNLVPDDAPRNIVKRQKAIRLEHHADGRVIRKWERDEIILRYNLQNKQRWLAILLYLIGFGVIPLHDYYLGLFKAAIIKSLPLLLLIVLGLMNVRGIMLSSLIIRLLQVLIPVSFIHSSIEFRNIVLMAYTR